MRQLVLLYWGCVFLMYLSDLYYPAGMFEGVQTGKKHFMLKKADMFMIIVIVWMTCFSFLRTSYNDTGNYIFLWQNAPDVHDFIKDGGLLDLTGNPLSYFWESLSHKVAENYHVYFFPPAFLSSFAVVKLIKRYSVDPAFSILIFFSIGTYITYIAAMKQCLAMFVLILSIPYAEERKYVRFYLLVAIAILFHTHAFMFLILPFLFGKPWGKVTWVGLAATIFAMLTYDVTLGAFMRYAQSIGALVDEGELFDGHQINIIRVFVYWVPSIIAFVFRKRLFTDSTRKENLFANMAIVSSIILMLGTVQAANLFARMAAYFEIAQAITIPWMIRKLFEKKSAKFVNICSTVLYFGYFFYEYTISKNINNDYSAISIIEFVKSLIEN